MRSFAHTSWLFHAMRYTSLPSSLAGEKSSCTEDVSMGFAAYLHHNNAARDRAAPDASANAPANTHDAPVSSGFAAVHDAKGAARLLLTATHRVALASDVREVVPSNGGGGGRHRVVRFFWWRLEQFLVRVVVVARVHAHNAHGLVARAAVEQVLHDGVGVGR